MANFPTFAGVTEDASLWSRDREENAIRATVDGGYEFTRPRFTRRQRSVITTGFSSLTQLNYDAICAFYDTHQTHSAFVYTHPVTAQQITVRFAEPMSDKWVGVGLTARWNVKIKLKEV